jgi:hypothetical protein
MGNVPSGEIATKGVSKIAPALDRSKMFSEGWWLVYCLCGGRVCGDVSNPLCGSEKKELCSHETCELTEVGNPFCSNIETCFCITSQCAFPKLDGSPTCVCFNKKLAGGDTGSWKPQLFDKTFGWEEQFWIYYFLCLGCSVNGPGANDRPMVAEMKKFFCIKGACQCVQLCEEGVWCSSVGTFLCYWDQCSFPCDKAKAQGQPWPCKCFNIPKPAGGGNSGNAPAPMGYGKPSQAEMS